MIKSKIKDICFVAVFACLLVLGSMFDFRFSDNIYSENNWFNIFIELIAKMPIYSIGLYACASLFVLSSFKVNFILSLTNNLILSLSINFSTNSCFI